MGRGSFSRPGRRMRLGLALTGAMAALAVLAPASQANFTTTKCQGDPVTGRGASFANTAHVNWEIGFENDCTATVGVFPEITYDPAGSGAGRRAMGERTSPNTTGSLSRNQGIRFGMTDEAPTATSVGQMNQGTDNVGDEGAIHVIPGAVGAVTMSVNWPNNCDRSLLPDASETNPASANSAPFIDRVRFTRAQAEQMWEGDSAHDQWSEIFPSLAADADCTGFITRVVRFDDSGTTFAFKQWLDKVDPAQDWDPGFTQTDATARTRLWPNASFGPRADCAGTPSGPQGTHLTSSCSGNAINLIDKLSTTDGGIGYADIATARAETPNSFEIVPGGVRDDDLFWSPITNQSGTFVEPTDDPNGYRSDGTEGANCEQATFVNVPASTLGNWEPTDATDSPQGWVICSLTYGLVWDDYKGPYSLEGAGDATEERRAKTVKDYWNFIVSDDGQELLFDHDYAQLPNNILTIARAGVNAVCWDKAGSGACPVTRYFYPRPTAATPFYAPLVHAYNTCTSPNRVHAAPLAYSSCNPPTLSSGHLTSGSPDANGQAANEVGNVKYVVTNGPGGNDADVNTTVNVTDVRNTGSLTDYTGQLQLVNSVQITDRQNGRSFGQAGTGQATPFSVTVGCATTVSHDGRLDVLDRRPRSTRWSRARSSRASG